MLLSIFNIRMKKKGAVMDYGNEKVVLFFILCIMGCYWRSWKRDAKKIEKRRLDVSVGPPQGPMRLDNLILNEYSACKLTLSFDLCGYVS